MAILRSQDGKGVVCSVIHPPWRRLHWPGLPHFHNLPSPYDRQQHGTKVLGRYVEQTPFIHTHIPIRSSDAHRTTLNRFKMLPYANLLIVSDSERN